MRLLLLALPAVAAPYVEVVDGPLAPDALDAALEDAAGRSPADATHVALQIRLPDGTVVPAERTLPKWDPPPDKSPTPPPGPAADHLGRSDGALSGKAVYLSQCHGWIWYDSLSGFSTQRGNLYDTVEDFHNPEGLNAFLAPWLENAGAAVFTARERHPQDQLVIVDDGGPGYAESGDGFVDGDAGFVDAAPWDWGDDPFDLGTTRTFPADSGATVTWTPTVDVPGEYPLYVSWDGGADRAPDAHYRITHPGGVIDRTFDQRVHGATWQYVETLWLPAGTPLTVELIADSATPGATLSADAIRLGGGIGDVERNGDTTGRPRWEEGANLYVQWNSAPISVYDPGWTGNGYDPSTRSRWAAWEHPANEDAVYLSWHSNAGGGTGTSTYTYEGTYTPQDGSWELGDRVQEELVAAIRTQWDADWVSRGHRTAAFAEVNPAYNDEMPSALVELAFHDHPYDVELLKDPRFRRDAARAMGRGIIRYFAERDGITPVFPPEPPVSLAVRHDEAGDLVASWEPGPVGAPWGDAAETWLVQISRDGRTWSAGFTTSGTAVALPVAIGDTAFVRVSAQNVGGTSFPSEIMGGRRSPDGTAPALVVPAFDRFGATLLPWADAGRSVGEVRRFDPRQLNGFDLVVAHGAAISEAGWYWESASDEAAAGLDLSRWPLVVWGAGEESSEDDSFDDGQQAAVRAFVAAGGALWSSGAEVLWDLDHLGSERDRAFATEVLGASMAADDAGTFLATGSGPLAGIELDFSVEAGAPYVVEWPDVLDAPEGTVLATYETGGVAAARTGAVAHWGFPFDAIGDATARAAVAAALLPELVPDYTPPEIPDEPEDSGAPDEPGTPGEGTGTPSAPPTRQAPTADGQGCGCGGTTPPGALALLLGGLALARRRRSGRDRDSGLSVDIGRDE